MLTTFSGTVGGQVRQVLLYMHLFLCMIDCKNYEWSELYEIYVKCLITGLHVTLCFENKLITIFASVYS